MTKKTNNLFSNFHPDSQKEVTDFYNRHKSFFISFLSKYYSIDENIGYEIYQESFLILHENIRSGKLTELQSSLQTYLLGIGKKKALKYLETQHKLHEIDISSIPEIMDIEESDDWKQKHEIVRKTISEMGNPCKKVLWLYYWNKKSMQKIALEMNYKGEQIAKNRKSLCLKTLKELLIEKFRKEDLI